MKPLAALLLLLAVAVFFLALESFESRFFFETNYSPPFSIEAPAAATTSPTGGAPRKTTTSTGSSPATTSSNPGNFRGPTGKPYIIGPSSPPPGQ